MMNGHFTRVHPAHRGGRNFFKLSTGHKIIPIEMGNGSVKKRENVERREMTEFGGWRGATKINL